MGGGKNAGAIISDFGGTKKFEVWYERCNKKGGGGGWRGEIGNYKWGGQGGKKRPTTGTTTGSAKIRDMAVKTRRGSGGQGCARIKGKGKNRTNQLVK